MNLAYNVDCMEYMKALPDKAFDLAVVDPPYGISVSHNIGRRKRDKNSSYKKVDWDTQPPRKEYFNELFRVSKNQIIWGANHFISRIPFESSCWIVWDKLFSPDVSFATIELAWTSFQFPAKKFAHCSNQLNRIHPTQKPVALYTWILTTYAKPGDRILDTHLGSGSSRIAAYDLGFDFVGCELDRDYFEAQEARFVAHTAQGNMFLR